MPDVEMEGSSKPEKLYDPYYTPKTTSKLTEILKADHGFQANPLHI